MNREIIFDGKTYEAIPAGSYHCSDCDLYEQCREDPYDIGQICLAKIPFLQKPIIFKLTDKLNEK